MSTMKENYEFLKSYFDGENLKYKTDENNLVILTAFGTEDFPVHLIIRCHEDREIITIDSMMPFTIPEDKRMEGAVVVAVANHGMIDGLFDYDLSDGSIIFRVAQGVRDVELTGKLIDYMIGITVSTVDRYNDKFFMYAKGMTTLEQFISSEG